MASSVEGLIERVMGELHHLVQTRTVVGEPLQAGNVTLIPVSKISFGFGAGGGQEGKFKSGTGGGATVEPTKRARCSSFPCARRRRAGDSSSS